MARGLAELCLMQETVDWDGCRGRGGLVVSPRMTFPSQEETTWRRLRKGDE